MTDADEEASDQAKPRRFYRIVQSDPPTTFDFLSNQAKGKQPRGDSAEVRRLWSGISVYDTWERAWENARSFPHLGAIVVELELSDDESVSWERTTKSPGHYTLWGDPINLLTCVIAVLPVNANGET